MHYSTIKIASIALAHLALVAADPGFSLAKDTYCLPTFAGSDAGGASVQCYDGTAVVPAGSWNCHTLQNPPASVWNDDNDRFHVKGNNFCGVGQFDMYRNGANFDVYIAGGDGTKVGYCYATTAQHDDCYLPPFSSDVWSEYMYCDLWGPGISNC